MVVGSETSGVQPIQTVPLFTVMVDSWSCWYGRNGSTHPSEKLGTKWPAVTHSPRVSLVGRRCLRSRVHSLAHRMARGMHAQGIEMLSSFSTLVLPRASHNAACGNRQLVRARYRTNKSVWRQTDRTRPPVGHPSQ